MIGARFASIGLTLAAGVALMAGGCSGGPNRVSTIVTASATMDPAVAPIAFQSTELRAGTQTIHVEIASTAAQGERGLGYRDALDPDAGMIFDLHQSRVPVFWMKGMRFPLDIVWVDASKRVTGVERDVPPEPGVADANLHRYSPPDPARYVAEVNAGAAASLNLTPGAQLSFDLPPAP